MIKYFIYCRKSSEDEERQILSIEAQVTELREYAKQNNLLVIKEFAESQTAKEPGRPIFNHMLSELEQGNAEGILAWNPDRLARNSVDGGRVIYLVDTGKIQSLKFPTFWFEATPQGKFMLSVAFGQAKYYTDNLSENILRGLRQKLRRGEMPTKAPLGYVNEPRLRTIEPDPQVFVKLQKILRLFASGKYTLTQIQGEMFSLGLVGPRTKSKFHLSSLQTILSNPFYYGMFRYRGEMYDGSHKPMISKKLFDQIQQALLDNGKPRKKWGDKNFIFLGLAKCGECGYAMTAERHIKKSGLIFVYYRCTKKSKVQKCGQKRFLRQELFAEQIRSTVQKVSLPDEWRDKFLAKLEGWKDKEDNSQELIAQNLKREISAVKLKLDRLMDIYLDGSLELIVFQGKKNKLMEQKADIEQRLKDFERPGNHWLELTRNWILEANQAENLVKTENYSEMSNFLRANGSNRRIAAGQLSVEWQKPWNYLWEMPAEAYGAGFARGGGEAQYRSWWSIRDSNP